MEKVRKRERERLQRSLRRKQRNIQRGDLRKRCSPACFRCGVLLLCHGAVRGINEMYPTVVIQLRRAENFNSIMVTLSGGMWGAAGAGRYSGAPVNAAD